MWSGRSWATAGWPNASTHRTPAALAHRRTEKKRFMHLIVGSAAAAAGPKPAVATTCHSPFRRDSAADGDAQHATHAIGDSRRRRGDHELARDRKQQTAPRE